MPDNYYSEGGSAPMAPEAVPEETPEEAGTQTALLPKEFFGSKPLEIGTECKVRIEQVMDDQVSVSYVPHEESEEMPEPRESEVVPPEGMGGEMAGYMGA